ncbi:hypothetical protein BJ508DRAFT_325629 [Ascobolus immersus RN42]|uniref:LysM domain-containing protein n=1 Tax=Ascobolus immersus RN42 TaxID=1160509 RepID=A0A3N4IDZ3_ASCIM|nr:hypothetical protein BJ508DRAFT_325629 [Ascobolus immersus RN42]
MRLTITSLLVVFLSTTVLADHKDVCRTQVRDPRPNGKNLDKPQYGYGSSVHCGTRIRCHDWKHVYEDAPDGSVNDTCEKAANKLEAKLEDFKRWNPHLDCAKNLCRGQKVCVKAFGLLEPEEWDVNCDMTT